MTTENDSASEEKGDFIYVACQNGAEAAAKLEIMSAHPNLKLAFSRPGFITFKVDSTEKDQDEAKSSLPEKFTLKSTLARSWGWSLGKARSEDAGELVAEISSNPKLSIAKHLHIWQRDPVLPGKNGFEPGVSALASAMGDLFAEQAIIQKNNVPINRVSKPDELIFDVVMVEPSEWWFGYHYATTTAGRWPGGAPKFDTSKEVYSRAYFKLKEALLWSGIKIHPDDLCAEIGSAPGGACQLLLEMGAGVLGIDPAEMEPGVAEHENFIHIRKRGNEVKKREFHDVKWLMADLNTAPNYLIEMISEIVQHESVDVKGVVLTLKFSDWKTILQIPELMAQVKALGFQVVKTRQLAFNRREFCMVALKSRYVLRSAKKTKK